jgi:hypothetical protein
MRNLIPGVKYKPLKSKPLVSDYPHCTGHGLLLTHFDGKSGSQYRIDWMKWQQFCAKALTVEQRRTWDLGMFPDGSVRAPAQRDDKGFLPDTFELFLQQLHPASTATINSPEPWEPAPASSAATADPANPVSEESNVATAMKKKVAKKAAKKAPGVKVAKGKPPSDTKPLPTMEDLDERVPALDTIIKQVKEVTAQRLSLKEERSILLAKVPGLFKKNSIEGTYNGKGGALIVEHGTDTVKFKKIKEG